MKIVDEYRERDLMLIRSILSSPVYIRIIKEFRYGSKFPIDGVLDFKDLKKWKRKLLSNKEEKDKFNFRVNKYTEIIKTKYGFINILNPKSFRKMINHSLFYNTPSVRLQQDIRFEDDCKLTHSWDTNNPQCGSRGIFIKISPYAKISEIKKFITDNSTKINGYQDFFQTEVNFKAKRNRKALYKDRDMLIYDLSQCTIEELSCITGNNSKHKDIQIEDAMNYIGYAVSSDHIRKIIQTQREKLGINRR
ncbi:hypothetical protein HN615_14935 [Candidatus Woesearchaeota archaeon]|nr:hypothetical protein [Candidatus Woesearchaeota archaeon]